MALRNPVRHHGVIANLDEPGARGPLLIIDDHHVLSQGLKAAFEQEGFSVFTTDADPLEEFPALLARVAPRVVLLDLWLGSNVGSGLGLIPMILAAGARVVILTASDDDVLLASCVEAGAFDLASKAEPYASIRDKVEGALGDGPGLGEAARQRYLAELAVARAADSERLAPFARLTPRERHVLLELMEGRSAQEIAAATPVALATVRTQIRGILRKLGVSTQLAAVALARRSGWHPEPGQDHQP
jgi:DNA-binding NarL/FixJ family response regulator